MSVYQPNVPTGTVDLDVDYQNLQGNFQQLDTQFGVDHVPFSNTSGTPPAGINGYHRFVHLNPFSTTTSAGTNNYPLPPDGGPFTPGETVIPSPTVGFGQIFSCEVNDGINADQALYFLTGGGKATQLTRNFQPVVGSNGSFPSNGYTFLPGGFILQWGSIAATAGTPIPVVFSTSGNIAFPANNFVVSVTAGRVFFSGLSVDITTSAKSVTGFTINNNAASATSLSYDWVALGN